MSYQQLVDEAARGFEQVRAGTVEEVANIPEEHFGYRPAEGVRTVGELARHILESGYVLVGEVLEPEANFLRVFDPTYAARFLAHLPADPSKDRILDLLRTSGAELAARVREAGDSLVFGGMRTLNAERESRLAGFHFVTQHEMYHRAQLTVYARGLGLVPALTKRIAAMAGG